MVPVRNERQKGNQMENQELTLEYIEELYELWPDEEPDWFLQEGEDN